MTNVVRQRTMIALFVLLCSLGALCSIARVQNWGNELSIVDSYSEANALREVRNFREQGLTQDYGLGRVYYPGMYPEDGFAGDPDDAQYSVAPDGVYTHYPPGPEYLLLAAEKLLGPEPVSRLRLVPISVGCAAMLFLGFSVYRRFGAAVGWLVMGTFALTPSVTDGFVGLHYQGYAAALLMVEIGIAIGTGTLLVPFALLGFLQGWLSFDYVFLVPLVPLALETVMPRIDLGYERRWRLAFARAILAGAGFVAAHGLHFLQVWAYWGSFGQALRDYGGAASYRAGGDLISGRLDFLIYFVGILKLYFLGMHPLNTSLTLPEANLPENWSMFRFLGLSLGPWWLLVTCSMLIWDGIISKPPNRLPRTDWHFVCLIGLITSSAWLLIMINHAGHHRHFLYRHLFFAFFVMVLFGAVRLSRHFARARIAGERIVGLDTASILPRSHRQNPAQETGHEIRDLLRTPTAAPMGTGR
jgi:hypothetical protein